MEEFKDELSIFAESFNMHGPGAVGDNLEKGTCAEKLVVKQMQTQKSFDRTLKDLWYTSPYKVVIERESFISSFKNRNCTTAGSGCIFVGRTVHTVLFVSHS